MEFPRNYRENLKIRNPAKRVHTYLHCKGNIEDRFGSNRRRFIDCPTVTRRGRRSRARSRVTALSGVLMTRRQQKESRYLAAASPRDRAVHLGCDAECNLPHAAGKKHNLLTVGTKQTLMLARDVSLTD
jgi:hypothetical protein